MILASLRSKSFLVQAATTNSLIHQIARQSSFSKLQYSTAKFPKINYIKSEPSANVSESLQNDRPLSPHLTIYEPQLTWLMSIGHRFTGAGLSAGIYAFGIYYALAQPGHITTDLATWIAHDCPAALFYLAKYVFAAPFVFHTLNGIRHLVNGRSLFQNFTDSIDLGYGLGILS